MAGSLQGWLTASPARTWLVSALIGAAGGPLLVLLGLLGLVVIAWLAIFVWYGRSRLHALSGMLTGFGLAWLATFVIMFNMALATDIVLWLAVGLGALVLGVGLLVAYHNMTPATRRSGTEMGREDSISYFRDFGQAAPGVREEDSVGRWGGRDDRDS
jgi:hypothetical protein